MNCRQHQNGICAALTEALSSPTRVPPNWCARYCKPNDARAATKMVQLYLASRQKGGQGCRKCGKLQNIVKGFGKLVWERISQGGRDQATIERAACCAECEHRTFLSVVEWAIGSVQSRDLPVNHTAGPWDALWCSRCKCCIEAKIRVPDEKCPLGKWQAA